MCFGIHSKRGFVSLEKAATNSFPARLRAGLSRRHSFAFLCTFALGLVVHFYAFTNFMYNHDGPGQILSSGDTTHLGRWFIMVANAISSFVYLPWVNGLLSLVYLGLAMAVITEIFTLQSRLSIFLAAFVLVAFPSITATYSYMFTADCYMLGVLFSCLAVLCCQKGKWGFALGGVFLTLSLGIYQAYISFAVGLILVRLFLLALDKAATLKSFLLAAGRYLAMGAIGVVGNILVLRVILHLRGWQLTNYQNMSVLSGSPGEMLTTVFHNIGRALRVFAVWVFRIPGFHTPLRRLVLMVYALLVAALVVYAIVRARAWRPVWRLLAAGAALALLPLGLNTAFLPGAEYIHMVILQPYSLFYMLLAIGLDKLPAAPLLPRLGRIAAAVLTAFMCFQFWLTANIAYTSMDLRMEKMASLSVRVVDRIEQTEGYTPGMPLIILGRFSEEYYPNETLLTPMIEYINDTAHTNFLYDHANYSWYLRDFHYLDLPVNTDWDMMEQLATTDEVQAMGVFPQANSVRVIDGSVVLKLSDEQPPFQPLPYIHVNYDFAWSELPRIWFGS